MPHDSIIWLLYIVIIPVIVGVATNILTPKVMDLWAGRSLERARKRIAWLEAEMKETEVALLVPSYLLAVEMGFVFRMALFLIVGFYLILFPGVLGLGSIQTVMLALHMLGFLLFGVAFACARLGLAVAKRVENSAASRQSTEERIGRLRARYGLAPAVPPKAQTPT